MKRIESPQVKRIILIMLLVFLYTYKPAFSQSFPFKFNYLTVDEGLSHTDANDIAQDKQGYIWVATYFGLNRYDGYTIKQYYNNNVPIHNAFKNRVWSLYPDGTGNIWLGTEAGIQCFDSRTETYLDFFDVKNKVNLIFTKLLKPSGNLLYALGDRLVVYQIKGNRLYQQKLKVPQDLKFTDMVMDEDETIYLSSNKGIWIADKHGRFQKLRISGSPTEAFSKVFLNNQKKILLASDTHIYLTEGSLNKKTGDGTKPKFYFRKNYQFDAGTSIRNIVQSQAGNYWINIGTAMVELDEQMKFVQIIHRKSSLNSLNSSSLNKIFIDRSQCLWACTFGGGVNYCDLNAKLFYALQHNPEAPNSLSDKYVRSILEEGDTLWIGTNAGGLNVYNLITQKFSYYNNFGTNPALKNNSILSLTLDNDKNLWIGSSVGIEILKPGRKKLWQPVGYENFPAQSIETLAKDYFGNIWFGNHTNRYGVIVKDKNNSFRVKYYDEGYFIFPNKDKPELLISSTHGLKRIVIDKAGNILKTFRYTASPEPNSLSSNYTYPISRADDKTYWIGTIGGGLNQLRLSKNNAYTIKRYTDAQGVFNDVESLEIDNAGNIWMGGKGLICLNPQTGKIIKYDRNDGLQGNSFKVGSSYKGSDGKLYFGGINGLNYFYPTQIKPNTIAAKPVLTDLLINNQKPDYEASSRSSQFLEQVINYSKQIKLSYLQNNFVLFFSAMHYANPLKCKYRYKLVGFDNEWRYTEGKNPSAAYSNLDYDTYQFVVQATNNEGNWSKATAKTTVVITPPWWKSTLAKSIYFLLILSGLAGIYIYQGQWYRLKREIEVRAVNEQKREEMHQQREELYRQQLQFFTNISHEFRTPLTLILGPLESLIKHNKDVGVTDSYQLMLRNAKRLVNLISELMNFKKVEDSIIKLQVQPLQINQFCNDLAAEFKNLSLGKDIEFKLVDHTLPLTGGQATNLFDVQILEKILFNLLNNSFKYTEPGGKITFELFFDYKQFKPSFNAGFELLNSSYRATNYIYFRVADTGIGISGESITQIFERYYRINSNHLGSGIGLALVKSLTALHKGDIYVFSERHKGTEIIIGLPWGEENYTAEEKASLKLEQQTQLEFIDNSILLPLPDQETIKGAPDSQSRKRILLVDDNRELRLFLKQAFEKHYHIYEAEDGNAAVGIATEKVPDLIISDVMMPVMNGIEFCRIVKEKFETRHIPFIILSAKDALDTKLAGMESGADYYFAKPLSMELLLLTVNNIFEQGETLKKRYTNNYLAEATELVHSEKDKAFLQQLLTLIEDNMQDPDLDVDFLCKALYISRTKLYQKIKSISSQSVAEFIRTVRLKKAIQIMTHEDIAINEVVDRVGLQSSSNFSRVFKKEYGHSPMQFLQSLKKNT